MEGRYGSAFSPRTPGKVHSMFIPGAKARTLTIQSTLQLLIQLGRRQAILTMANPPNINEAHWLALHSTIDRQSM